MSPPAYADLGKSARDLFSKGFNIGLVKVETSTKSTSDSPLEFKTGASHNVSTGRLFGTLDIKYKFPKYGVTLTEKWNTENVLGTEIVMQDQGMEGLKMTFDSSYSPNLGKRTGKIKADMAMENVFVNTHVTLDSNPVLHGAVVGEHNGFLLGAQGSFDMKGNKLYQSSFSLGYKARDYALHTYVNENTEFGATFYHQVNEKVEIGTNLGWSNNESGTRFAVAAKYKVDSKTSLHGKFQNHNQIGLGVIHNLTDKLKITASVLAGIQNFNEGQHKFGIGLDYSQ